MVLPLVLALLTSIPEASAQKQICFLEGRLAQFPPETVAYSCYFLSRDHLRWLNEASAVIPEHRREAHGTLLSYAENSYACWDCLKRARRALEDARRMMDTGQRYNRDRFNKYSTQMLPDVLDVAETYMDRLETMLGDDSFCAGRMPPPVPFWYFQWID